MQCGRRRPRWRPRATGREGDAGTARQLPIGFRHDRHAVFVPAGDCLDAIALPAERVEDTEEALLRHVENEIHTVEPQRISQNFAATSQQVHLHDVQMIGMHARR